MNIILCNLFWTDVFPSIWWGLIVAVVVIWALYIVSPLIKDHINSKVTKLQEQHRHEKEMKIDAFEREKEWYFIERTERPLKIEEELKKCQEELGDFKKKEKELNEGTASLRKNKEQFEKNVLETKIKVYEEIIKNN